MKQVSLNFILKNLKLACYVLAIIEPRPLVKIGSKATSATTVSCLCQGNWWRYRAGFWHAGRGITTDLRGALVSFCFRCFWYADNMQLTYMYTNFDLKKIWIWIPLIRVLMGKKWSNCLRYTLGRNQLS